MTLKDKTVLVTGGSKGIGRSVVEAMAKQGANVIINFNNDEDAAKEVANLAVKYGIKTLVVKADITKAKEVEDMITKVKNKFGYIDVLVASAGLFDSNDSPESLEAFRNVFETNLFAQVELTNAAREIMSKGKIVFVSSIHGKLGHGRPDAIAYSASKAALNSYVKNLAKHLAPEILVNAVSPGRTITPMWGDMSEDYKKEQAAGHLINRWIEPSEIADGVVFLAKNDAVCGEVLVIDGGMSLKVFG